MNKNNFKNKIENKVCGTCKHFQTCESTEGWRRNFPCTKIGGVKWEKK